MKILITGGRGFLGRNLATHLSAHRIARPKFSIKKIRSRTSRALGCSADVIFHLAGVNRPKNPQEFETGNAGLTEQICQLLRESWAHS